MAIRIPFGIDPDETWELDYCAEIARMRARIEVEVATSLRESAAQERSTDTQAALLASATRSEKRAAAAQEDLAGYVPGSGPVFRLGAIPGRRRAELLGRQQEVQAMPDGKDKAVALAEWSRDVVCAAVKGHRNLRTVGGRDIGFESTDGRPSDRTLEAYASILVDLAWAILGQQRLGADGKNG